MGKAPAGNGSVYRDQQRNRWIGQIKLDGKRRRVIGKTEAIASTRLRELIVGYHRNPGVVLDGNATLRNVIDLWTDRVLPSRKLAASTVSSYEWMADLWREELGTARLRALTVDHVEAALDRLAKGSQGRELGVRSLTMMRQVLIQILDTAINRRMIDYNPASHAKFSARAKPTQPRRSLTKEEADALWDASDAGPFGPFWRLMLKTGLRPGEAAAIKWDALDLESDQPTLNVSRSVRADAKGKATIVDDVKTAGSYRTIALSEDIVDVLKKQRSDVRKRRLATSTWVDNGLVFPNSRGGILDRGAQVQSLKQTCNQCGIVPAIRPHELRHTTASLLSDQRVPHEQIADLLGHESTQMLDRVYRHRLRTVQDAAISLDFGRHAN
jgi:integrase